MTDAILHSDDLRAEIFRLCDLCLHDVDDNSDRQQLESLLAPSEQARDYYLEFIGDSSVLRTLSLASLNADAFAARPESLIADWDVPPESSHGSLVDSAIVHESQQPNPPDQSHLTAPTKNQLSLPLLTPSKSSFFSRPVLQYVALVALCLYGSFALIAWNLRPDRLPNLVSGNLESVAVVRDAADVQWSKNAPSKSAKSSVCSGEPLKIESGTIELELKAGAKLVVEGPADWSVVGQNSVLLRAGKLLASVPKQAIGFTVETPTAKVVDLGTEFRVEVSESGATDVHVVRGTVEVDRSASSSTATALPAKQRLVAGQAIRVDRAGVSKIAISKANAASKGSATHVSAIDLADIVAGGDGRTHRRDRGLDPTTGRIVFMPETDYSFIGARGSNGFQRTDISPMIDGVAVIDPSTGPVQLTSALHTFDRFPKTSGSAYGPIWAGGSIPNFKGFDEIRTAFDSNFDFAVAPHGLIALIPNKLITFDLAAMRRAYPDRSLSAFYAVAGMTKLEWVIPDPGLADIWVFVDGVLRHQRLAIKATDGPREIRFSLKDTDRFLTLATTDGGNTYKYDWIMFGNPRIELKDKN